MTSDVSRDLETRIRQFASQRGRVPTSSEVRALMAELGLTRDSVADLAEDMTSANDAARKRSPSPSPLPGPIPVIRRAPTDEVPGDSITFLPNRSSTTQRVSAGTAGSRSGPDGSSAAPPAAEPVSAPPAAGPSSVASTDGAVRRLVDDLTDDWHRQGGRLSDEDVTRLVAKRGLSASQQAAALSALADLDISVDVVTTGQGRAAGLVAPEVEEALAGTSLSSDQLKDYLRALRRTPLLFAEDEVRLGRAIQAGLNAEAELAGDGGLSDRARRQLELIADLGRQAQRELVQANLRLVVSVAKLKTYQGQGLDLADRIQEGNLGLMRAAVKFDPNLGYKFSTYASWWIRQAISRGLADRGRLIRLPVHVVENLNKIRGAWRALTSRHGREPTSSELAEATGLAEGTVRAILDYDRHVGSLDAPVASTDGDLTFGDLLSDDADVDGRNDPVECALASAMRRDLDDLLGIVLDDRARDVLERRSGYDGGVIHTLDDIGKDHGVTRERIRQIESKAYSTVRSTAGVLALYEYLCDELTDEPPTPADKRKPRDDGDDAAARKSEK